MWGGNVTAIDILVKSNTLSAVRKELTRNNIRFAVVIEDIQQAIDDENPPQSEDDEELEIRQGK